jgi:uncharacterized membrane-anchored protein
MNNSRAIALDDRTSPSDRPSAGARLFHTLAAALLCVMMLVGFQQFYFHGRAYPGRDLAPPIRTLRIVHGSSMTLWMLLFLVQPLLIVARNRRLHMTLGKIGAVLAAAIVVVGVKTAIESVRVSPPGLKI